MGRRNEENPWEAAAPRGTFGRERPAPGPVDGLTRTLMTVAVLLQAGALLFVALSYPSLPESVPTHFDGSGEVDRWGSRGNVWVGPGVIALVTALLLLMVRGVRVVNLPVSPASDAGWQRLYLLSRRMLGWMAAILSLLGWVATLSVVRPGLLPGTSFWPPLILLFAVMAWYIARMLRPRG
jgi:uncharacterized membrane protein